MISKILPAFHAQRPKLCSGALSRRNVQWQHKNWAQDAVGVGCGRPLTHHVGRQVRVKVHGLWTLAKDQVQKSTRASRLSLAGHVAVMQLFATTAAGWLLSTLAACEGKSRGRSDGWATSHRRLSQPERKTAQVHRLHTRLLPWALAYF